jgi:metal-dependent amidase/aminoacylase/carboxypeptidase family protein
MLFRLGVGRSSEELHNPAFDFNDDALGSGIAMLVGLAQAVCKSEYQITNNQ